MNKFDFTHGGGQPFFLDDLMWNDDAYRAAFTGLMATYGDNFKVSGCNVTGGGGNPLVLNAGYVVLNGELLQVDEKTYAFGESLPVYFNSEETTEITAYITLSPETIYPYKKRRAVLTSTPSPLSVLGKKLIDIVKRPIYELNIKNL
jgi:hypothetical protein